MPKPVFRKQQVPNTPPQDEELPVGATERPNQRVDLVSQQCDLAYDPRLIARIQKDTEAVGVVGEVNNSTLIYLTFTSRVQEEPNAVVTRGGTGLGKTHLLHRIARFMPPETVIDAMSLTDASMFNVEPDFFKHKIMLCGERRHSTDDSVRDQNRLLRQFQSEKRISRNVSVQGKDGVWRTEQQVREGPIAYGESTTANNIFREDGNRLLHLFLDDSYQQTQDILVAKASRYAPDRGEVDRDDIFKRHHEFQRSLVACDVRIPFWRNLALAMPATKPESRRVFQQVLTVIESIVVLHQHQREKQNGYLLATFDDYELARQLLLSPIHSSLGMGRNYKKAERLRAALPQSTFTTAEVTKAMNYKSKMGASHLLSSLAKAGLVKSLAKASGTTQAKYQWNDAKNWDVLPTVNELKGLTGNAG